MTFEKAMKALSLGHKVKRPHWTTCVLKCDEWGNKYLSFDGGGQSLYFAIYVDIQALDWLVI